MHESTETCAAGTSIGKGVVNTGYALIGGGLNVSGGLQHLTNCLLVLAPSVRNAFYVTRIQATTASFSAES